MNDVFQLTIAILDFIEDWDLSVAFSGVHEKFEVFKVESNTSKLTLFQGSIRKIYFYRFCSQICATPSFLSING